MFGDEPQADESSPVLPDERDLAQIERIEHGGAHPFDMAGVGVVGALRWFVGATEPDEVGRDAAQSCRGEDRDHLPVEEAPGRFAVHEEHYGAVARAFVEIVDAQPRVVVIVVPVRDFHVVRGEWKVREAAEAVVGRAQRLHRAAPLVVHLRCEGA